jgi:hydrogenase expression/formation protein HypD
MNTPQLLLKAIADLPLPGPVRVLNLCGDQERAIGLSGLRRVLPEPVSLVAGPGCVASICPQADVFQAIQLARRHPLTLLAGDNMLRLPIDPALPGPPTLAEARLGGADVRPVSAPIQALLIARAQPVRETVLFLAGFETLLAPLAGMILQGLPENLSLLICGRRVEPLLEQRLRRRAGPRFDALLLPGNRCAVTGTHAWERIIGDHRLPAAVAGYTGSNLLAAVHAVLRQHCCGEARVDNCYRALVRPEGNAMVLDQLERVFEVTGGAWRGLGYVQSSGFRLRHAYRVFDADGRFPDYRGEASARAGDMPAGCECAAVVLGTKAPVDCRRFDRDCRRATPQGPCMASEDGACHLHSRLDRAA